MSTDRILLDSNAYFRLADTIPTLLSTIFGKSSEIQLRILGGTAHEFYYEPRLRSKFSWADKAAHKEERKVGKLIVPSIVKNEIAKIKPFMLDASNDMDLTCSRFDIECLACAKCLNIPLVTDDLDLRTLAGEYDVATLSTLELLKLMLDKGRTTLDEVQATVVMWDYLDDYPADFLGEFRRLFATDPERL